MKQIYKKYNSFLGLRLKKKYDANDFLSNLKSNLNDKKNLINFFYHLNLISNCLKNYLRRIFVLF